MSKHKSELEDKIEQLEQELEDVKSLNKALMRRLKAEGKLPEEMRPKQNYKFTKNEPCTKCQGEIEEVEIAGRKFSRCVSCGKRTKAKKV